jgi:hypothetical protein
MVKVAEWTDTAGMTAVAAKYMRNRNQDIEKNKTYIITTLLDEPYMMLKQQDMSGKVLEGNEKYEGYCKDLADLIAKRLDINCKMKNDPVWGFPFDAFKRKFNYTKLYHFLFLFISFFALFSLFFMSVRDELMLVIEYLICFIFSSSSFTEK